MNDRADPSLINRKRLIFTSAHSTMGLGIRATLQAILLIIVARELGVSDYGLFAAIWSVTAVFTPFSGMGYDILLIRASVREPSAGWALCRKSIHSVLLTGIPLCIASTLIVTLLFEADNSLFVMLFIPASELIFIRINHMVHCLFLSRSDLRSANILRWSPPLSRLIVLAPLMFFDTVITLESWATILLTTSVLSAITGIYLGKKRSSDISNDRPVQIASPAESLQVAVGQCASNINQHSDKLMLSKLTGIDVTGAYTIAMRVIELFSIPVNGIISAIYPQIFSAESGKGIPRYNYFVTATTVMLLTTLTIAIYLSSALVPLVFGYEFSEAASMTKYLCLLPTLLFIKQLTITRTISDEKTAYYTRITCLTALVNILLNLILIPIISWKGAITATYTSDLLLISLLLIWGRKTAATNYRSTIPRQ